MTLATISLPLKRLSTDQVVLALGPTLQTLRIHLLRDSYIIERRSPLSKDRRHPDTTPPCLCSVTSPYLPHVRFTPYRTLLSNIRDGSEYSPLFGHNGGSAPYKGCGGSSGPAKRAIRNSKDTPTMESQEAALREVSTSKLSQRQPLWKWSQFITIGRSFGSVGSQVQALTAVCF